MKAEIHYSLSTISTIAGLIPFAVGLLGVNKYAAKYKLFYFFVLASFLNDFSGFIMFTYFIKHKDLVYDVKDALYILVETLLSLTFLAMIYKKGGVLQICIYVFILLITCVWVQQYLLSDMLFKQSIIYDCFRSLIISMLAAYSLILWVEKDNAQKVIHEFWFLAGMFFYFFCGIFLFLFFESQITKLVKPAHDIINIITCLVLAFGFALLNKSVKAVN